MSTAPVLVLTSRDDLTADMVVRHLNLRGVPVFRCDTAEFPQHLSMSATLDGAWTGTLRTIHRKLPLEAVCSVYYRHPTRFAFPAGMSDADKQWAGAEARLGFGGLLASLPCRWINHPMRMAQARYKPLQLRAAAECGLRVPATLLTNSPEDVRRFAERHERIVYKALSPAGIDHTGAYKPLYTTVVPKSDQGDASVALTANLFQAWVDKSYEVRMTVVGDRVFAAEIHVGDSEHGRVDWRADYDSHRYRIADVPEHIRYGASALLRCLGLHFGAFDFIVPPSGDWVFLEVNTNGQWGWLEDATGLPISAAIADDLERGSLDDATDTGRP